MRLTELEKMEYMIASYKSEQDTKRRHVYYLNVVEDTLKLVHRIVAGFSSGYVKACKDDLIQIGALGALKAIAAYEPSGKSNFRAYALKFIKGEILHYLRDKADMIKLPRTMTSDILKIKECLDNNSDKLGLELLSAKEISRLTGIKEKRVKEILDGDLNKSVISLDQKVFSPDGPESLIDMVQDFKITDYEEVYANRKILEFALNRLSKQEKEIICKYYIEDKTQKEISVETGISTMQVSRIIKRALNKMYDIIQNELKMM